MRLIALITSFLLALAAPIWAQIQGVELDEPVALPMFELSSDDGTAFTEEDLINKWTIIMFGFNTCPDVCPFTLANLEAAVAETGVRVSPKNLPGVVFVSVDPERDRNVVSEYASFFHPDFRGVTGERDQIDTLVEATDSFYRLLKPDSTGFYDVQHSSAVSVVDPEGMLRAKLQPPFDPGATAEFLARLQIAYKREKTQ